MNIQMTCYSNCLHVTTEFDVIIPQSVSGEIGFDSGVEREKYPVLWLLHGATDDHTTWQRRTSIERYAAPLGLAVVMPNGHLSSYVNMAHGEQYYDYISKELPALVYKLFPISNRREDNFIAGNSMGGYGAMMIGINNPDRYSAIGCFSAAARHGKRVLPAGAKDLFSDSVRKESDYLLFGGKDTENSIWDTLYMAEQNAGKENLPRIFHTIGTEDFLIDDARRTRDFFNRFPGNRYPYVYEEHPGTHGWDYWDEHIRDFLAFLNIKPPASHIAN